MATIGEFRTLLEKVSSSITHFGATEDWKKDFWKRVQAVDVAIMDDFQLCTQQSALLADDTELGSGAQEEYDDLLKFLENNRTKFSGSLL